MNQKGFTLIELIVIIVILGILAVTAIPRYVDMKTEAEIAAADGVYGACQGATSMNFASGLLGIPGHVAITTSGTLVSALDAIPEGWIDDGTFLCRDADGGGACDGTYDIGITTGETTSAKAVLSKTW
ncbi:MAG: prepilin-type N-terminal cleavage/methylation domain-containing protein [Proteobacteria bacterium]|nr:prepilin-type N-terminal cleavage/methylation domain-containing protein [Pseudomonadota bacterium]MBU1640239.1 prepilin-type N-terminal cleavage/methylation domain-containing protein [Pseudomonadota bacterium]